MSVERPRSLRALGEHSSTSPSGRFSRVAYFGVLCLVLPYALHRARVYVPGMPVFWDARVYLRALQDSHAGVDPYAAVNAAHGRVTLPFVGPPIFLLLMQLLSHVLPGRAGAVSYLLLTCGSTLALPALLAKFYLRSRWMSAALCLFVFCFQPGKYGIQALLSGNVSNILYAAVLASGVLGLQRKNWIPFFLAVFFAGLIKPPFLAFLALPVLIDEAWLQSVGVIAAVLCGDLAQRWAFPAYWREFQQNVYTRVFVNGDAGFGWLGQLNAIHLPINPALACLVFIASIFAVLWRFRARRLDAAVSRIWLPCLVLFAILSNPRMLSYDADLAIIPAVCIVVESCLALKTHPATGLKIGIPLTVLIGLVASKPEAALGLFLVSGVVLVLAHLLRPPTSNH